MLKQNRIRRLTGPAFACLLIVGPAGLRGAGPGEKGPVREALWSYDFNERPITMEALPGTYLAATTVPKKIKKNAPVNATLWLLDGKEGKVLWSGPDAGNSIIAGEPHPVLVRQGEESLTLQALSRGGETIWEKILPGVSLSAAVDAERGELILAMAGGNWYAGAARQTAKVLTMSLADGEILWQAEAGELDLPVVIPANIMALTPKTVWLAVGGRAMAVSRADGRVAVNQPFLAEPIEGRKKRTISSPLLKWDAGDQRAALAMEGTLAMLSLERGLEWTARVEEKDPAPDSVAVTERAVVAGYRLLKKERSLLWVGAFAREDGRMIWTYVKQDGLLAKNDRVFAPPPGMAVSEDRAAVCVEGNLVGLDLATGRPAYTVGLSNQEYSYAKEIRRAGDLVILFGKFHMRGHDLKTGALKWRLEDYGDPKDYVNRLKKVNAGLMAAGMQASATMQEFSAKSMQDLSSRKLAGRTGSTHKDYVISPSGRGQLTAAAQMAGQSSAWYRAAGNSAGLLGVKGYHIDLIPLSDSSRRHVLPRVADTSMMALLPFRQVSALAVDLETGRFQESEPFRARQAGCLTALCIDVAGKRVYYANHKDAPACRKYTDIQAYPLPPELLNP